MHAATATDLLLLDYRHDYSHYCHNNSFRFPKFQRTADLDDNLVETIQNQCRLKLPGRATTTTTATMPRPLVILLQVQFYGYDYCYCCWHFCTTTTTRTATATTTTTSAPKFQRTADSGDNPVETTQNHGRLKLPGRATTTAYATTTCSTATSTTAATTYHFCGYD